MLKNANKIVRFLIPKQTAFFDSLKELSSHQVAMARLFDEFTANLEKVSEYARRAKKIEHEADDKTYEIIDRLNKTFVTPLDREDLYSLTHNLDDIVDLLENAIQNVSLYDISKPRREIKVFAELITQAADQTDILFEHLRKRRSADSVRPIVNRLHEIEDEGDEIFQKAISRLFHDGDDPLTIIKWKDIFENLEKVLDKYQTVSDSVEGVLVKAA